MEKNKKSKPSALETPMDFRTFFDLASVLMVVLDDHQRVAMINNKGCEILGRKMPEIVGKNWFDEFLPLNEQKKAQAYWNKIIAKKAMSMDPFESSLVAKGGERRMMSWNNTFLTDSKGHVRYILSSGEDVTELRKPPHFAMIACSPKGTILDANRLALDLLGHSPREPLTGKIFDLFSPNSSRKFAAELKTVISKGYADFEIDMIHRNHQVIQVRASGSLFKIDGKVAIFSFNPIL